MPVALAVVPAEGGRLVFLAPAVPLEPARTYRLSIAGAVDEAGARLAAATITFSTKSAPRQPKAEETVTDAWQPNARNGWRTNRPPPRGVASAARRSSRRNGDLWASADAERASPARVTLSMEGTRTENWTGRFLLQVPTAAAGRQVLEIGSTANWPGRTYGFFEYRDVDRDGRDNCAALHDLDAKARSTASVTIPSPTTRDVVITTPTIPGLELHIPAQTMNSRRRRKPVTRVSLDPGGSPAVPWSARR